VVATTTTGQTASSTSTSTEMTGTTV
jgi:hypothetical protein